VTTISKSTTTGINLNPALYTSPVVIDAGVTITNPNYPDVVYRDLGSTVFFNIQNNGTVAGSAAGVGVYLAPGGSVTNAVSASITGYTGVKISGGAGTVVNHGSIAGLEAIGSFVYLQFGVDLKSGGAVTNEAGASITGRSVGVDISGGTATVVNLGSIGSTGGTSNTGPASLGVDLQSGGSVTNKAGASITGDADGVLIGDGADAHGGGGTVVAGTVANYGSIAGAGFAGVNLLSGGSVRNAASASIIGFYRGIEISGGAGTVVNYGSIAANATSNEGVLLDNGGSVTNEAGGSITGFTGVDIGLTGGAGTVVNRGNISGRSSGVSLYGGASAINAASGTITGATYGVGIIDGGTLTNAGLIVGNSGTAVYCHGIGSNLLVLDPGFEFTGLVVGNSSASNTLELASAASAGTVTGLGTQFLHFNSIVFDAGAKWSVSGLARGLAGTISGFAAGDTIKLTGGGTLKGTISGGGELQLDNGTVADTLAQLPGIGSVVVDTGAALDLSGGGALPRAITGAGTLDLSGAAPYKLGSGKTIGTAHVAVDAGATLTLDPGFSIVPTVHGGGAKSTLELAAGAGPAVLNALGTKFTNFGAVTVDSGATWTVDALASALSGVMIAGSGGHDNLVVTGAGTIDLSRESGFPTIALASTGANTLTFTDANFAGATGASITVDGGNAGNTINAAGLTGADRVIVWGGAGKDVLTGGAGNDIFKFTAATLTASDTVKGGGGNNEIDITTAGTVAAGGVGGVEIWGLANGGADSLTLANANFAGVAGDTITVYGGNGGDTISEAGVAAADRVAIKGGAGADTLIAGQNAVMTGGAGKDVFWFTTPGTVKTPDTNTVTDFAHGSDRIAFSDGGFALGLNGASATLKSLPATMFTANPAGSFTTAAERFAYDTATGALYYDAHGNAAGSSSASRSPPSAHTPILAHADLFCS
jgi:hypothetical protein